MNQTDTPAGNPEDFGAAPEAPLEVVQPGALEVLHRAEIDSQIHTAKQYPRSLEKFKKGAIAAATIDEETAGSCLYHRPVGKKRDPKTGREVEEYADGMSVRMAEIVGANYGNLRVYARIIEQTPRKVICQGVAIDLENNFASSSECVESTVTRSGQPYSERMALVVAKACLSKARRDATFQVVPRALARPVEAAVRKILVGDEKSLAKRRAMVLVWMNQVGIEPPRVYAALGIEGEAELDADKLITLQGLRQAIIEKETTVDEAFPPVGEGTQAGTVFSQATPGGPISRTASPAPTPIESQPKAEKPARQARATPTDSIPEGVKTVQPAPAPQPAPIPAPAPAPTLAPAPAPVATLPPAPAPVVDIALTPEDRQKRITMVEEHCLNEGISLLKLYRQLAARPDLYGLTGSLDVGLTMSKQPDLVLQALLRVIAKPAA